MKLNGFAVATLTFIAVVVFNAHGQLQFCSSTTLPAATVGKSYSTTICAEGGTVNPYQYSKSGNFPPWSVPQDLPTIDGTPTTATTYSFTITVKSGSQTISNVFALTVNPQQPPTVTTLAASSITTGAATLNTSVNPNAASTTLYFQYGQTTSYGSTSSSQNIGTTSGSYNIAVSGLSAGTPYHFRAVAYNVGGTNYGSDMTFTTSNPPPPTVTTLAATSITSNSATLNLSVNPNGASTTVYFEYGPTKSYGSTTFSLTGITSSGNYGITVSSLTPNTTYHFQAVAYNSGGTSYGGDLTFWTPPPTRQQPPTVTTLAASSISSNSATLNLSVNPNGASTTVYFEYGPTKSYGSTTFSLTGITSSGNYGITVSSLTPNTTYHFQAVAYNSGGTSYGGDLTFTPPPPISPTGAIATPCINGLQVEINGAVLPPHSGSLTNQAWTWGDGYQDYQWAPASHIYPSAGSYSIIMTQYWDDGSRVYATGTVYVATTVLSGCYTLTLFAGQGGAISYQACIGTNTVPAGGSVTLQTCYGGDFFLTASPSFGYAFSNWLPSPGISQWAQQGFTEWIAVGSNSQITANFSLQFPVSPARSTLTVTPSSAPADGSSQVTATATLRDVNTNPLSGKTVTFYASEVNASGATVVGSITVNAVVDPTGANGQATATITANTAGTVTIWAVDTTDSVTVQHTTTAQFTSLPTVAVNSDLTAAISALDALSQPYLTGILPPLSVQVGQLGDYFCQQAIHSGAKVAVDAGQAARDLARTLADNSGPCGGTVDLLEKIKDQVTEAVITATAVEGIAGAITTLETQNNGGGTSCNPANLFDTSTAQLVTSDPSSQIAVQAGAQSGQKIMAAAWLQQNGESIGVGSLTDANIHDALYSGWSSPRIRALAGTENGLSQLAPQVSCLGGGLAQDLTKRKTLLLQGLPSATQQSAWAVDLQARSGVPLVYYYILSQYEQSMNEMEGLAESAENSWLGGKGAQWAWDLVSAYAIFLDCGVYHVPGDPAEVFTSGAQDTVNSYVDAEQWNGFEQWHQTAMNTMQMGFTYTSLIWLNEVAAFAEMASGQNPYPQTVTGTIGTPVNNSIGILGGLANGVESLLASSLEQTSYSEIPIQNTSGSQAMFDVYAFYKHMGYYNSFGWQTFDLIQHVTATLGPGQSETLKVAYTQELQRPASPDGGTTVVFRVLGSNGTGVFYIGTTTTIWLSNVLPGSGSVVTSYTRAHPLTPVPLGVTNPVPIVPNPIGAYSWTFSPSNQSYSVQLNIWNPFNLTLMGIVTQSIPTNITVVSTDGLYNSAGQFITWTNILLPYTNIFENFTFTCPAAYGSAFTVPAAALLLEETNSGATLTALGNPPQLVGLAVLGVSGIVPTGTLGIDSEMQVAVSNLTVTNQAGSLTITVIDSTDNVITNVAQSFSLSGSAGTNLSFTLPGSLPAGSYLLTGSLSINGGTGQVLAGTYVVPAPPVTLRTASSPPLTTNGFSLSLSGAVGNYLIEASPDISIPTNWQPIAFYAATNAPFCFTLTDGAAANYACRFYRAIRLP